MRLFFSGFFIFMLVSTSYGLEISGQEFDFSGYLETRHGMQVQNPNAVLVSGTMARIETRTFKDAFSLFASTDISVNHEQDNEFNVSLHEAYFDYVASSWDLRLGRQIIIWGNSDGVTITDNISPSDLSEYISRDFDEIRMAVDALKLRFLGQHGTGEFIYIPFFKKGVMPKKDSPWNLDSPYPFSNGNEPEKNIENGELGLKYSLFQSGMDLAFSYFYTWNDFPYYTYAGKDDSHHASPEFHRLHIFGLEFSRPYHDVVFRGEAAFLHGNRFASTNLEAALEKKDRFKWLLGMDYYPGANWSLLFQVTQDRILGYSETIHQKESSVMLTANISKKMFRENLVLSGMHYWYVDDKDSLTRLIAEYHATDKVSLFFGADIFKGEKSGVYGRYKDNTQVWTKLKYSF